ncbi:MAG: helix-turn-helix domain-containing protein [Actinomycetota bacterium]|nr:helix-turn-helix domain-containing protein [Actinomycetota bacterium]
MAKKKKSEIEWRSECPIASGLDILGDKWSLLIVRDLFICRTRTYSEFCESPEKIATNILANRLKLLTSMGVIERVDVDRPARNNAYRLTKSGKELRKVLEALGEWSYTNLRESHPDIISIDTAIELLKTSRATKSSLNA